MIGPTPRDVLAAVPTPCASLVRALAREGERLDVGVFLVGGPVRDLLLGRPLRDVDLIVEGGGTGTALALAESTAPQGARIVAHGRFGTVRVALDGVTVDLATVRSEAYARPGALPSVGPGSLEDDLRRRDFTVNALAIALNRVARHGRPPVIEADGGRRDLEAGVLRVFHPRSFHDDPTRALRAARLAARLAFSLSRGTRSALRDALRDGAFGAVSGDRLRREIEKLFEDCTLGLDPPRALRLLAQWHVLGALEPGLELPRASATPLRRLGRALAAPPWPPGRMRPWAAGLAVWLAPLDATLRRRTLRRLSVRGELAQRLAGFPKERDAWLRALARAAGRGAIDALLGEIDEDRLLALHAWAPAPVRRRIVRWANQDRARRPPVGGADLVALGLSGPAVGRALARLRAAYLDGTVRDRADALALARELARTGSGTGGRKRPRVGRRGSDA